MKKVIACALLFVIISACRSGLYPIDKLHLNSDNTGEKKRLDIPIKSYNLDEFDIYTFSICEDPTEEVNNARFSNCKENFYDLAEQDTILKVEELYLLRHKPSSVVIYLTTQSERRLRHKKGFLNDRSIYENKIILKKLEYAYIGKVDTASQWIHFPNQNNGQDIILHYNEIKFPNKIELTEANIATAENKYTTDQKIKLDAVFGQPIVYSKGDYKPQFFKKKKGITTSHLPQCLNIISRKGKVAVVFGCIETDSIFFKISNRKVRYNTNFFLLPK